MRKKLTTKYIDALRSAENKRYEVRDVTQPGLLLRVSITGSKVWNLGTRYNGRLRRIKIGTYPILSLADARERARSIQRDIQLGRSCRTSPLAMILLRLASWKMAPWCQEILARTRGMRRIGSQGLYCCRVLLFSLFGSGGLTITKPAISTW